VTIGIYSSNVKNIAILSRYFCYLSPDIFPSFILEKVNQRLLDYDAAHSSMFQIINEISVMLLS